jgi:hypothetical protein
MKKSFFTEENQLPLLPMCNSFMIFTMIKEIKIKSIINQIKLIKSIITMHDIYWVTKTIHKNTIDKET